MIAPSRGIRPGGIIHRANQHAGCHAKDDRDDVVKSRNYVASKMTPAQIAEAQKLAREWKPKLEKAR
jgi:hypothetical protein